MESTLDLLGTIPDPPSPPSPPSPPDTPTPTPRVEHNDDGTHSDLGSSIHALGNPADDQMMCNPPSPNSGHTQTAEEQAILAHLELAEMNRSVLSQSGLNNRSTLPQFTPTPNRGFPKVHMSHSAQIFDHLETKVLLAWFQVGHPKFMIRVFDYSGKDVAEQAAIIAERIWASITTIAEFISQDAPPVCVSPPQPQGGKGSRDQPTGFLVHQVSEETMNLILSQRIWSTTDITFEALLFNCSHPPELLFCLSGFTTLNADTVRQTVVEVWSQDEIRCQIKDCLSNAGCPTTNKYTKPRET
ncbi:hypothetical protein DFJ58DRAFT_733018 [Suillus subalutaceus]|uniref:uncharacterized protein n=1 Tax=Suillus subalutaceus TaxID=48586 RepID=UPI001B86EE38|nr:uncharacterized protein DFJ58DRAFT_733018 [Suillus subalutaceus]KAG1840060.1 hypothetical protein DFJ58DRAFT_733018 [Suillus subalutaceus]